MNALQKPPAQMLMPLAALVCLLASCVPSDTMISSKAAAVQASPAPTKTTLPSTPVPSPTPIPENTPVLPSPTLAARAEEWWDDTIFYEVFVRSFSDSDGDGISDFQGVICQLHTRC